MTSEAGDANDSFRVFVSRGDREGENPAREEFKRRELSSLLLNDTIVLALFNSSSVFLSRSEPFPH